MGGFPLDSLDDNNFNLNFVQLKDDKDFAIIISSFQFCITSYVEV